MVELTQKSRDGYVYGHESARSVTDKDKESRLILVTEGRYSHRSEATLLRYRRYGNDFLVIASNNRHKSKPDWYLNLKEEPIVRVELGGATSYARAVVPTGMERVRLLPLVGEMMHYADSIPRETSAVLLVPMC